MYNHHYVHFMHTLFANSSDSFLPQFLGAFAGAFFAFVFGLIAYRITKRWERFVQHKNALVKLERIFSRHLNEIATLENLVVATSEILNQGKLTSNRLYPLKLPEEIDIELASIDLINKFFSYQGSIDRNNINVSMFNHALTRFEDMMIAGQPLLMQNLDYTKKMLDGFKTQLPLLSQETKKLLILTRIHLRKLREKGTFFYGVCNSQWDFDISEKELKEETQKFDEENRQLRAENQ